MIFDRVLEGRFVNVRSVEEADAEFILRIRNDPEISKFLPPLNITVEQQREWIRRQRTDDNSFYVLFVAKDGMPLGTYRLYDIEGDHGEVGSLCSYANPAQTLEGQLLFIDFIFCDYKMAYVTWHVHVDNKAVLLQARKAGVQFEEELVPARDGRLCYKGKMTRDSYEHSRKKTIKLLDSLPDSFIEACAGSSC